jgi:hypothetical protein
MTAHPGTGGPPALRPRAALAFALAVAILSACTSAPPAPRSAPAIPAASPVPAPAAPSALLSTAGVPQYRCEQGLAFTVKFSGDSAVVDAGPRGREVLLRDAGGVTPQQTVYSNTQLRAEFGLGVGNEAILHFAVPPLQVRCIRD